MKTLKNSDGFSALHALLILIIVGIVGFTGWYVWHANKEVTNNLKVADTTVTKKKASPKKATSASKTTRATQAPDYATSIQILSISDDDVLSFKLNGVANTDSYFQNWSASSSNALGHIPFTASQTSPDTVLTTRFVSGPFDKPTTYSVRICEDATPSICSNTYQVTRSPN